MDRRRGFPLIELLVVISIIALLRDMRLCREEIRNSKPHTAKAEGSLRNQHITASEARHSKAQMAETPAPSLIPF
ncbi:MAG: prepilin-type N-terminal cleavage/methylation domain-containing protein [Planctomycetes bacterium]|nr:prepilin-type N-terminal cleavage/methylation domain-containing protein [Planctomycetota bacterium]